MGLIESFLAYAKSLIVIESKVSGLHDDVHDILATLDLLTDKVTALSERVARIEGKFEAYETMAQRIETDGKQIDAPKLPAKAKKDKSTGSAPG